MSEREIDPGIITFFEHLAKLDAGQRARMKRCAGQTLSEASGEVLGMFYRILPPGAPRMQDPTYFTAASLFPLADGGGRGNLGDALRQAQNKKNNKGLDRRVEALLDADDTQLPFRLRQAIHFLQSNRVRVNWPMLLDDLLHWTHPERFVQKSWALAYFKQTNQIEKKGA